MKKRNNLETAVKGLLIAVAVILALVLSALALYMSNRARTTANDAATQFTDMMASYNQIEITQYDKMNISGSQVKEVISNSSDKSYTVTVVTKVGDVKVYGPTTAGDVIDRLDGTQTIKGTGLKYIDTGEGAALEADDNYINPSGTFTGEVTRNDNNMVIDIRFTQKK